MNKLFFSFNSFLKANIIKSFIKFFFINIVLEVALFIMEFLSVLNLMILPYFNYTVKRSSPNL